MRILWAIAVLDALFNDIRVAARYARHLMSVTLAYYRLQLLNHKLMDYDLHRLIDDEIERES